MNNPYPIGSVAANHFEHFRQIGIEATRLLVADHDRNRPRHHWSSALQCELGAAAKFIELSKEEAEK